MAVSSPKPFRVPRHWTLRQRLDYYTIPEALTSCHLCWASPIPKGYANIRVGNKMRRAHRVAWELSKGLIPFGMHVCHRCDTPACVNPDHLFLGTNRDNALDCKAKGRNRKGQPNPAMAGERMWAAKLTDEKALSIFRATGLQRDIAKHFGIDQSAVSMIKSKKIWKHIHT